MCRFFLEFLGPGPAWWGYLILFLAAMTAFLGVLYALMENDLKKLLAYSSVENIGILLLGIGAALVFASQGQATFATFAWVAVLFHALNHAIFKSLLFMVAGAIVHATHTRNLERLGGLVRTMPLITVIFFIGSASIAAIPPFNGFASEWLTLQTLFLLTQGLPGIFGKLAGALLTAILGLTGALAAACFVKFFGVVCLGKPRSQQSQQAEEAPIAMLLPVGVLAGCCLVLGIWPQAVIRVLQNILAGLPGLSPTIQIAAWHMTVFQSATGASPIGIIPVLAVMVVAFLIAYIPYRVAGKPVLASGETWTCGIVPNSRMQYTATGFSKPVRRAFGAILQPQSEVVADSNINGYFGRKLTFHSHINYLVSETLYRPLNRAILRLSGLIKQLQAGSLQLYIGYIMAATILTLLWSTRWQP
jgi:hydrogenase-4 component B